MRFPLRRTVMFLMRVIFLLGQVAAFYLGWRMFYAQVEYWFYGYIVVLLAYGAILLAFTLLYGGLKVGEQRLGNLVLSAFLSVFFANVVIYFVFSLIAYAMLPVYGMLAITAAQFLFGGLWCYGMNRAYFAMSPPWEVVAVFGDDANDRSTVQKMSSIHKVYHIARQVDASLPLEEILGAIEPYESVLIGSFDVKKKNAVMNACYRAGKRINLIPSAMDVIMNNAVKTQIMDTPVLLCRNREMTPEQVFLKRLVDVVVSALGLVIASPIFLFIAIAIKANDGGPVLFRQERLTLRGRSFTMLKFRSMQVNAEAGLPPGRLLAGEHDPRITRVGRFIRQFRLDELPQLINVLRGEMSMVGPRPERPEVYAQCEGELPEFSLRMNVKAGLTGYAQIYGRYNTSLRDKLNLDLFYIESYSPQQDLWLLMMTVKVLFIKESSQGEVTQDDLPEEK